jgi:hypothetical protein
MDLQAVGFEIRALNKLAAIFYLKVRYANASMSIASKLHYRKHSA